MLVLCTGEQQILTHSQSSEVVVDVADLGASNKKSVIHVLHVDDDPSLQEITKLMLLDLDNSFEFDSACCVDDALKKLSTGHYDVVVSDYEMPQKDGLQFLTELRKSNNEIPFILFTGKGREEVTIKALNLGADGYHNKQGSPETVYGELAHGIHLVVSRRKTEEALMESEKSYRDLINRMNDTVWVIGFDGKFVEVNDTAVRVLGYSRKELLSMGPSDIDNNLSREQIKELVTRMPADQVQVFETAHTAKNGKVIPVEISSSLVTYKGKQAVLSIARNITERKKSEKELAFSERKYRIFADSLPEIVFEFDDKGMLTFVNKKALEITGYSSDEVKHLNIFQCLAPCDRQRAKENVQRRMQGEETVGNEYLILKKDGATFPGMIFTEKIITEEGKVGLRGVIVNITQNKKAEALLRDSEEKYRELFEGALDAIFLADAETGILIDCNRAASELVGRAKSEIVGQHQRILHPAHEIEGDAARAFKQHQKQDGVIEAQVITKTGEIKDVSIKSSHIVVGGRKVLQGVFRDITESRKIVENLLVSERRLKEAQTVAHIGNWEWNIQTGSLTWGAEIYRILDLPPETVPSMENFLTMIHPDDAGICWAIHRGCHEGKTLQH